MKKLIPNIEIFLCFLVFVEGRRPSTDVNLKTLVTGYGYPFEVHETTTDDDYILELHRISGGRNEAQNSTAKKQVVLMMHGLIGSSASWLITGPNRSLALTLADKNYDVWLGNNRGNTYSQKHKTKLETSYDYWDFSWHEFGMHDLPAMIDYVLNKTGAEKLLYVGFSQGCTQLMVMGSLKPEYNDKIEFAILFAPAVFMGHTRGILTLASPITYLSMYEAEKMGYFSIGVANPRLRIFTKSFCSKDVIWQRLCLFLIFTAVGFGYDEVDRAQVDKFLAYEPAGSSWKQIIHYGFNNWNKGHFRLYDYGKKKNKKIYNSTTPPDYPLENVNIPMVIYHGKNDYLAAPKDVELLASKLPIVLKRQLVQQRKLNHYDFVFGLRIKELAYDPAFKIYKKYMKSINKTLVTGYGYPFEVHETTTDDDYILELHRISGGRNEAQNSTAKKQVVLMMHGFISSSASWLITGPNRSFGNSFTIFINWHEMGIYDLPAMIDYILNKTGEEKLLYVGFSQGCTQLLVMGSLKPEYNKKVQYAILLAPGAFMGNIKGILSLLKPIVYPAMYVSEKLGYFSIANANPTLRIFLQSFCSKQAISQELCIFLIFTVVGFGYDEVDRVHIENFLTYEPAGSSWKQVIHYGMNYWNKGHFRLYDYGKKKNKKIYNSTTPPEYPLENVDIPIAMYHGTNDYVATPQDIELLGTKLPNLVERQLIKEKELNHYDFLFGLEIKELVYNQAHKVFINFFVASVTLVSMGNKIYFILLLYCYVFDLSQGIIPDTAKKITRLIEDYGYLVQTHHVITQDGYILEIQRIPGIKGESVRNGKPPVLIMHGLVMSSADWVVTGPNTSLAFLLVENGYDVWLGNNRGNTFGKNHTHFLETSYGFWDFSWHEFGIYDLPAMIDYILKETNTNDLNYICYSQGCTQFLVMGSLKPEYNKKIRFTAAMAPAAYFKYTKGLNALVHNIILLSKVFVENFGYFEFFPAFSIIRVIIRNICWFGNPFQNLCYFAVFSIAGIGIDEMDPQRIADQMTYFPAGCSYKQLIHYHTGQLNGAFCQYDYGPVKNLHLYNSTTPPKYPIERIKVPVAVFYGANDFLTSPGDVLHLASKLPNVIGKFVVKGRKLNHLDFIYGKNVRKLVYYPILKILTAFRKS
ncbi:uncharacterized protein LOC122510908 [Leptopilina heterotoma]|uniref:uncharacterized protein LOC122510908 n=1 Tax=Leptopilina heterotoma TaxID=63436 RepID=UPI001CA80C94|nr:uncharacterized protein LOC122510908 [Leptopilina heterotoma]